MWDLWAFAIITAAIYQLKGADSVVVPTTSCYVLDNSSHIFNFSTWIGHPFEHDGKDTDTVIRFCKDVESRSQAGYVNFGRFDQFNYFAAGSVLASKESTALSLMTASGDLASWLFGERRSDTFLRAKSTYIYQHFPGVMVSSQQ